MLANLGQGDPRPSDCHYYPYAHYLFNASLCVTAWLTAGLAVERYILVCHAAQAKQLFSTVRVHYVVIIIFVVTSVLSLPFAFRYRTVWTPGQVELLTGNFTNTTSSNVSTIHIEVSRTVDQSTLPRVFQLFQCLLFAYN